LDELGISWIWNRCLKIEGRMKGALYLATVVRTYRTAMDNLVESAGPFHPRDQWKADLDSVSHRHTPKASCFASPTLLLSRWLHPPAICRLTPWPELSALSSQPLGAFLSTLSEVSNGWSCLEVRSRLVPGMILEFLHPDGSTIPYLLDHFEDLNGNRLYVAHPNTWIRIPVPFPVFPLQVIRTAHELLPYLRSQTGAGPQMRAKRERCLLQSQSPRFPRFSST